MKIAVPSGQQTVRIGGLLYAVRKDLGLADRIASQSQIRGNWNRVREARKGSRVISNYRFT